MATYYAKRALEILREEGPVESAKASKNFLYNRRIFIKFKQWWKYSRHYEASLDPFHILWIDPNRIYQRNKSVITKSERNLSHVIGGEWDQEHHPFEERMLYKSMESHFIDGIDWKQTELYNQVVKGDRYWRGISSESEFGERCQYLDNLYDTINSEGYKTYQQILGKKSKIPREIKVKIGRNGDFFYLNGKHRLSIAKILGIETVPVNVIVRHKKWQELRDQIHNNGLPEGREDLINHPDLKDILKV